MIVSVLTQKMVDFSKGNLHDINHFINVYTFAKTIGTLEGLDQETQLVLEIAAIVHDIACPLCREKYGNTNGKLQEQESPPLVRAFLKEEGLTDAQIARIAELVGHHHTLPPVLGIDHQILLEADYLVNAGESNYPTEAIVQAKNTLFKTTAGCSLLSSIYGV